MNKSKITLLVFGIMASLALTSDSHAGLVKGLLTGDPYYGDYNDGYYNRGYYGHGYRGHDYGPGYYGRGRYGHNYYDHDYRRYN